MRRGTLLSVSLLLVVLSAGCLGFGEQPERSDRAEARLTEAQASLDGVVTYHYETEMHVSATAEGETLERDVRIDGDVDVAERLSVARIQTDGQNYTSYVTNRTVYRACGGPWGWGNESLDVDGEWVQATPIGRQLQLLESGDLRVVTNESLAQEDTLLLVGHPSPDALQKYGVSATQPVFGGPSIENITVRVLVDNHSHRPIHSNVAFQIEGGGGSGSGTIDTRFNQVNEDVSIVIPDEVKADAWETGCPGS